MNGGRANRLNQSEKPSEDMNMPRVNFDEIDDMQTLKLIPAGSYAVRIVQVDLNTTKAGKDMWRVKFAIEEGPSRGRFIWDNLPFTEAAYPRLKRACEVLGVDVSGEVDLNPDMFVGGTCRLHVIVEKHAGKQRNSVTFDGYEKLEE